MNIGSLYTAFLDPHIPAIRQTPTRIIVAPTRSPITRVTIYDNGGTSNYANNSDGTLTIYPSTAKSAVRLQFSQFVTESWDYLYVYNGTSTSASQIGIYYGTTIPADIVASNASGALTLRFYSDGSSNYSGFVAQASCVPLYSQYLLDIVTGKQIGRAHV